MGPWCRFLLLCSFVVLGCEPNAKLPPQLQGRWITGDARYQGRSLELNESSISFATGTAGAETFLVRHVRTERDPVNGVRYAISYGAPSGGDRELRLHVIYGERVSLQLGDRPERWLRAVPR